MLCPPPLAVSVSEARRTEAIALKEGDLQNHKAKAPKEKPSWAKEAGDRRQGCLEHPPIFSRTPANVGGNESRAQGHLPPLSGIHRLRLVSKIMPRALLFRAACNLVKFIADVFHSSCSRVLVMELWSEGEHFCGHGRADSESSFHLNALMREWWLYFPVRTSFREYSRTCSERVGRLRANPFSSTLGSTSGCNITAPSVRLVARSGDIALWSKLEFHPAPECPSRTPTIRSLKHA